MTGNKAGKKQAVQDQDFVDNAFKARVALDYGVPLMLSAGNEGEVVISDGSAMLGVAMFQAQPLMDTKKTRYEIGETPLILRRGRIWVKVKAAVTANSIAAVDVTGGFGVVTTGYTAINGVFLTAAGVGEYSILELR